MKHDTQFTHRGFVVWGIAAFFFMYEFLLRTVTGSFQHPIMNDLNLSSFEFSLVSTTIFLFMYGVMQIPVGIIVDYIGLKKALLLASIACTISCFGFASSNNMYIALFFRLFMGFGAAFGYICILIAVHDWMPRRFTAVFIGLSNFIGTMGPMLAAGPLESLAESPYVNWRYMFTALGVTGAIIAVLVLFFVTAKQNQAGKHIILNRPERITTSLKRLFTRSQPWILGMFSCCLYFTIEYLSENEGRSFLTLKGMDMTTASYMLTISWFGYAVGSPTWGAISDLLQKRKPVLILTSFISVASIFYILYGMDITLLKVAFLFFGIGSSGQAVAFATVAEQHRKQFLALGFGLNNAIITVISAINAPMIGMILDRSKNGGIALTHDNYITAFTIIAVLAVGGVILALFFIKETYAKSVMDFTIISPKSSRNSS